MIDFIDHDKNTLGDTFLYIFFIHQTNQSWVTKNKIKHNKDETRQNNKWESKVSKYVHELDVQT